MAQKTPTGTLTEALSSFFVYVNDTNTGKITRVAIPGDTQIGMVGNPAELMLTGRISFNTTQYFTDNVNKGVILTSNNDTIIGINLDVVPVNGQITVTLPANPRQGQVHYVMDMTGTSQTVPIYVYPALPGQTIDNSNVSILEFNYSSLVLCWLNGQWRTLATGAHGGINNVVGEGGTTAEIVSNIVTISSSIYANPSSSYLMASASNGDSPTSRYVAAVAQSGIQITDNGPGNQIVWSLVSPFEAGQALDGLLVELPGVPGPNYGLDGVYTFICPSGSADIATMGGMSGSLYAVTLQFRGAVAPCPWDSPINGEWGAAAAGTWDGQFWMVNGTPQGTEVQFILDVSDPPARYCLNAEPSWIGNQPEFTTALFSINYTKTIPIRGGAHVTLTANATSNGGGWAEPANDSHCWPSGLVSFGSTLPAGAPPQPFLGEFVYVTYVSSSLVNEVFVSNQGLQLPGGAYQFIETLYGGGILARSGSNTNVNRFGSQVAELMIDNTVVATLSGSTFSGPVKAPTITATSTVTSPIFIGSLQQVSPGVAYIIATGTITVSTNSLGQIIMTGSEGAFNISGSGGTLVTEVGGFYNVSSSLYADDHASYLLMSSSFRALNSRLLVAGSGIQFIDGGPGGSLTIIASSSISENAFGIWTDTGAGLYATSSVSVDQQGRTASQIGTDVWFFVSGTQNVPAGQPNRKVAVFGGDLFVSGAFTTTGSMHVFGAEHISGDLATSGSLTALGGLTGSLTHLTNGQIYMVGLGTIVISTNSLGQVILSGTAGASSLFTSLSGIGGSTASNDAFGNYTVSSSIGADKYGNYIVAAFNGENPNERKLTAGDGIVFADNGPGNNWIFALNVVGAGSINVFTASGGTVVVSGSNSNVTAVYGSGGSTVTPSGTAFTVSSSVGANKYAQYVVVNADGENPNERKITAGSGISIADAGGNLTITNTGVISGTTYADAYATYLQVSPDLNNVESRYVVGQGGISVIDGGPFSYFAISSSIGSYASASYVVVGADTRNPNERVLTAGAGITFVDSGPGGTITVNGTIGSSSIYANVSASFVVMQPDGENPNERGLLATGGSTLIDTGPGGTVTISSSIGAYPSSSYIVLGIDGRNPNERRLVQGNGITYVDHGPGGDLTLSVSSSIYANVSSSYLVLAVDTQNPNERRLVTHGSLQSFDGGAGSAYIMLVTGTLNDNGTLLSTTSSLQAPIITATSGFTGSLTQLVGGNPFIVGTGNTTVSTGSLGQIIISSTGGGGTSLAVYQASHGFTTGQAVYYTGSSWALAEANNANTLGIGVVQYVDANNFILYQVGEVTGLSGLSSGQYYFVSDATPGLLTTTAPTATTSFSNPLFFAISTTAGLVLPFRPSAITSGSSGGADAYASYILASSDPSLTNSRLLTAGSNITINDGGPLGSLIISSSLGINVELTGSSLINNPHSIMNFTGSGVAVSDVAGVATVFVPYFQQEIVFIAGDQTTESNSAFFVAGARSIDTTQFPATMGSLNRYMKFIATLQNTAGATKTKVQLYDVRNLAVITSSSMDNSGAPSQVLPYDVISPVIPLGTATGSIQTSSPGMYEVQVEMVGGSTTTDASTCSNARLIVYYA